MDPVPKKARLCTRFCHVEVVLRDDCTASEDSVRDSVQEKVALPTPLERAQIVPVPAALASQIELIRVCGNDDVVKDVDGWSDECSWTVHVYRLEDEDEAPAELDDEAADGGAAMPAFHSTLLPARSLEQQWDALVYDSAVKARLLSYVGSAMRFARAQVNSELVAWNRVVLLHGPPGTGKTSLCKALAHKLAVRFRHAYRAGQLLEVNAHSLFSHWFSESGKLVMRMFERIHEIVHNDGLFVCVLIDEVESLAAARKSSASGAEPSDAIRVVNALLTQLDRLRRLPNVLVMCTSNITGVIDLAFVDRADLKLYIGPPGHSARYEILRSAVSELMRTCIVPRAALVSFDTAASLSSTVGLDPLSPSARLLVIAAACQGLSGRALRKLPFLAHSLLPPMPSDAPVPVESYLDALEKSVDLELEDRKAT